MALGDHLHAVVLAGGSGERFWPLSRHRRPKPFLSVLDGRDLMSATLDRARRFAAPERVWVVCGKAHARLVRAHAGVSPSRLLAEPERRNTAMAAGYAAARIAAEDPEAVLAVLPADHAVPDPRAFAAAIRRAARAAAGAEVLVTLGVRPTRPDTGYGYIQSGDPAGERYPGLRRVRRFVEKPAAARARRFLRNGGFYWNAGVFVWKARVLLEEIERHAPDLHEALEPIRRAPRGRGAARAVAEAYRRAPSVPVDVAVAERSRRIWTLPVDFHWSDVGTWLSLAEELGVKPGATRVIDGDVVAEDAGNNLVRGTRGRVIALLGVEGLAVIDTDDALLVTRLDRSGDVRRLITRLRDRSRHDLLD